MVRPGKRPAERKAVEDDGNICFYHGHCDDVLLPATLRFRALLAIPEHPGNYPITPRLQTAITRAR